MSVYCRGMKNVTEQFGDISAIEKSEEEIYGCVIELGEKVWEQQLYLELLEDLIRLPYAEILPNNTAISVQP